MLKLFSPENRSHLSIFKNMLGKEQATCRPEDVTEAATVLASYLEEKVRQIQEPHKSR